MSPRTYQTNARRASANATVGTHRDASAAPHTRHRRFASLVTYITRILQGNCEPVALEIQKQGARPHSTPAHTAPAFALATLAAVILALAISACGSDSDSETGPDDANPPAAETDIVPIGNAPDLRAKTRPNATFTYDHFVQAGWKQYQVYDIDTLPDAIAARYGFFQQRDVEIRQYPDHETALSSGTASAEEALSRRVHDGSGFASRRVYGGYLVAGNLVMLCEFQVSDCIALIEAAEANNTP